MPVETLSAFSPEQLHRAHRLLAARVAHMGARKFEEGDWADVYCGAKEIPRAGWSNLNIDIMHHGLGVEHKMMSRSITKSIADWCGTTIMHPAATRALRIDSIERDANDVMADVFRQYADLIKRRTEKVSHGGFEPDMRTGWLLWQESLRQFLYFEERMTAPNPDDYYAVWNQRVASTSRLGSKNLWIYDRETKTKRYSVTTQAGIKLQPYFTVPPVDDPHLYVFVVQGEEVGAGLIRLWLTAPTARDLLRLLGGLDTERVSHAILHATAPTGAETVAVEAEEVVEVLVTDAAYEALSVKFVGASDEHRVRAFLATSTHTPAP